MEQIGDELFRLRNELEALHIERNLIASTFRSSNEEYELEKQRYQSELSSRYVTEDVENNENVKKAQAELENKRQKLSVLRSQLSQQEIKITEKENEIS